MKIKIIDADTTQVDTLRLALSQLGFDDILVAGGCVTENEEVDLLFHYIDANDAKFIDLLCAHIEQTQAKGLVLLNSHDESMNNMLKGLTQIMGLCFFDAPQNAFAEECLKDIINAFVRASSGIKRAPLPSLTQQDVRDAFAHDNLFVVYQPQFDFRSGRLFGVEALVRLEHEQHGICASNAFLHHVHDLNLATELYARVLHKASLVMGTLGSNVRLSVNITRSTLETDICDLTLGICRKNDFSPSKLTLELSEDQAYINTATAYANLAKLRLHGIGLSIDDFGTGQASFDKLIDLPFTELKIDNAFIQGLAHDYKLQQMTKLSLQLGHSLGLNCVAEGVEDEQTWSYLKDLGMDICQGYHTGKPMLIQELVDFLSLFEPMHSTGTYAHVVSLVMLDNAAQGSALGKLLEKEFTDAHIIHVNNEHEALMRLRDMPINVVVCDDASLIKLRSVGFCERTNKFNGEVLVLAESRPVNMVCGRAKLRFVQQGSTLTESARLLRETLQTKNVDPQFTQRQYASLSKRELDVAQLLVAGFTNKHISYELGLNQKTVSTYKTRILQKLNVKSTVELVKVLGVR